MTRRLDWKFEPSPSTWHYYLKLRAQYLPNLILTATLVEMIMIGMSILEFWPTLNLQEELHGDAVDCAKHEDFAADST